MAKTKKWNVPELKKRVKEHEQLKNKGVLPFLKKVLGVRKDMSGQSKESIERGRHLFNKIFKTNYVFVWKQTGEADIYNLIEVKERTGQLLLL